MLHSAPFPGKTNSPPALTLSVLAGNVTPPPHPRFFFLSHIFCPSAFLFFLPRSLPRRRFHLDDISSKTGGCFLPFSSPFFLLFGYFSSLFFVFSSPFLPFIHEALLPARHYPLSPTALCGARPSYLPPSGASSCGDAQRLTGWHCATEPSRPYEGNILGPF